MIKEFWVKKSNTEDSSKLHNFNWVLLPYFSIFFFLTWVSLINVISSSFLIVKLQLQYLLTSLVRIHLNPELIFSYLFYLDRYRPVRRVMEIVGIYSFYFIPSLSKSRKWGKSVHVWRLDVIQVIFHFRWIKELK